MPDKGNITKNMLNWLKGLFGGNKAATENAAPAAAPVTPAAPTEESVAPAMPEAPAQDMTGGDEEVASDSVETPSTESSEEVK